MKPKKCITAESLGKLSPMALRKIINSNKYHHSTKRFALEKLVNDDESLRVE